jgi:hypothetical protein
MRGMTRHARAYAALVLILVAAGCGASSTQPPAPEGPFPTFSLVDVNPNTLTSGFALTQSRLAGPSAIVYFGHAT